MKYVFLLLALGSLFGTGEPPVRPPVKAPTHTWAALLSVDSLRFVLLTRAFRWSALKLRAAQLLRALPPIVEARPHYERRGRDWERDFNEILFVFPHSVFTIQALDTKGHVGTPTGIYLLRDTLAFQQLRRLLNRRADHKEQFDTDLTPAEQLEIQQPYNQHLLRHASNGVARDTTLQTVWKTSWFVLH
jgi:hypothetical protein